MECIIPYFPFKRNAQMIMTNNACGQDIMNHNEAANIKMQFEIKKQHEDISDLTHFILH